MSTSASDTDSQLHLFTYGIDESKMDLLQKSAYLLGFSSCFHPIVDPPFAYEGYVSKIFRMRDRVANLKPYDIVCFVDAYDVVCNGTPQELLSKFTSLSSDIVLCGELNSYPEGYDTKYPELPYPRCVSHYKYVNSGCYIGYASALMHLYTWKSDDEIRSICSRGGDQTYFIEYYLAHVKNMNSPYRVYLDSLQSLFQCMYKTTWSEFIVANGRLVNTVLQSRAVFVHFNGQSFKAKDGVDLMQLLCKEQRISASLHGSMSYPVIQLGSFQKDPSADWGSLPSSLVSGNDVHTRLFF